jgi:putative intracellular protease/amidase
VSAQGTRGKIGVLIENHFDPTEYKMFGKYFQDHGYEVEYMSYLWGNAEDTYSSNPEKDPQTNKDRIELFVRVTTDITKIRLSDYKGFILIGAYAMDRLRYEAKPRKGQPNQSPAVNFLRRVMGPEGQKLGLKLGTICHSLWLLCAEPTLLRGRKVTCAHNLIYDVQNAGADVQFEGDGTAKLVVDGNLITAKHPGDGITQLFMEAFLKEIETPGPGAGR